MFACSKASHNLPSRPAYYIPFSFWIFSQIEFWFSETFCFFSLRSWTINSSIFFDSWYLHGTGFCISMDFYKILLLIKRYWNSHSHIQPCLVVFPNEIVAHVCFYWTSSSFTGWSPHRRTSSLLGLPPSVYSLMFLSFPSLIDALGRWETIAWRIKIWSASLFPQLSFNGSWLYFLLPMFTFWVICINVMWYIFHWWCSCHNLPI